MKMEYMEACERYNTFSDELRARQVLDMEINIVTAKQVEQKLAVTVPNCLDDSSSANKGKDTLSTSARQEYAKSDSTQMTLMSTPYPFKCALCGKQYKVKESLEYHLEAHTGTRYTCDKCTDSKVYTNKKAFKAHESWHESGCPSYKCDECSKTFQMLRLLKSHKKSHGPPTLKCRVHVNCMGIFTFESERKYHESKKDIKTFKCSVCFKLFGSLRTLTFHKKSHDK